MYIMLIDMIDGLDKVGVLSLDLDLYEVNKSEVMSLNGLVAIGDGG